MSLINDALKRAQETQQNQPPTAPAGAPLRPVEDERRRGRSLGLMLAAILVLLLVAIGILLLQWIQMNRQPARKPVTATEVTAPIVPSHSAVESRPAPAVPVTANATATQTTQPVALPATSTEAATPSVAPTTATEPTPPPVAPESPKPEFKLQGVSYVPGRSTAVVNGRTVRVGDRVGDARVLAIAADAVTLVHAGETNVLTFAEGY